MGFPKNIILTKSLPIWSQRHSSSSKPWSLLRYSIISNLRVEIVSQMIGPQFIGRLLSLRQVNRSKTPRSTTWATQKSSNLVVLRAPNVGSYRWHKWELEKTWNYYVHQNSERVAKSFMVMLVDMPSSVSLSHKIQIWYTSSKSFSAKNPSTN